MYEETKHKNQPNDQNNLEQEQLEYQQLKFVSTTQTIIYNYHSHKNELS